jgi:hypothetical protein
VRRSAQTTKSKITHKAVYTIHGAHDTPSHSTHNGARSAAAQEARETAAYKAGGVTSLLSRRAAARHTHTVRTRSRRPFRRARDTPPMDARAVRRADERKNKQPQQPAAAAAAAAAGSTHEHRARLTRPRTSPRRTWSWRPPTRSGASRRSARTTRRTSTTCPSSCSRSGRRCSSWSGSSSTSPTAPGRARVARARRTRRCSCTPCAAALRRWHPASSSSNSSNNNNNNHYSRAAHAEPDRVASSRVESTQGRVACGCDNRNYVESLSGVGAMVRLEG